MQRVSYTDLHSKQAKALDEAGDDVDLSDDLYWSSSNPAAFALFKESDDAPQASEALAQLKMMEELADVESCVDETEETVESVDWSGEKVSGGRQNESKALPVRSSTQVTPKGKYASPAPIASKFAGDSNIISLSSTPGHQKSPSVGSVGAASSISSSSISIDNAVRAGTPRREYSQADYVRLDEEYKKLRNKFEHLNRERCRPGEVRDTVERMIDGKPFVLEYHKKLDEKIQLLDSVLGYGDGDLIIMVLLFIKNTLSFALFQEQLLKKPLAANHYIAYLRDHCKFEDLTTTLFALGRKDEAAMVEFQFACNKSTAAAKISALKHCYQATFSSNSNLSNECQLVAEYVDLLERQQPIDDSDDKVIRAGREPKFRQFPKTTTVVDQSVLTTLYYCCLYHYDLPINSFASPLSVREHHKLSDKQFAWIAIRALARRKSWVDIQQLLTSKSFFGGSRIKSPVPVQKLLLVLANNDATPETLSMYVRLIGDADRRLQLAAQYRCHEVVVDCLVAARDRLKLIEYGSKLVNHTKEAYYLEAALNNSANKWKN